MTILVPRRRRSVLFSTRNSITGEIDFFRLVAHSSIINQLLLSLVIISFELRRLHRKVFESEDPVRAFTASSADKSEV